jgi:hypothetical protein
MDCLFHQILVNVLIPGALVRISSSVTQAINFANGLESCLKRAMKNCPAEIMHIRVSAASALAHVTALHLIKPYGSSCAYCPSELFTDTPDAG